MDGKKSYPLKILMDLILREWQKAAIEIWLKKIGIMKNKNLIGTFSLAPVQILLR